MKKRTTSGSYRLRTSRTVKKLPSDFDIFSLSTRTNPLCIQVLTNFDWLAPSDCAISFS